jgi:hypothetical protein
MGHACRIYDRKSPAMLACCFQGARDSADTSPIPFLPKRRDDRRARSGLPSPLTPAARATCCCVPPVRPAGFGYFCQRISREPPIPLGRPVGRQLNPVPLRDAPDCRRAPVSFARGQNLKLGLCYEDRRARSQGSLCDRHGYREPMGSRESPVQTAQAVRMPRSIAETERRRPRRGG